MSDVGRIVAALLVANCVACGADSPDGMNGGGGNGSTDAGARDSSVGPDQDGDDWGDTEDNCPSVMNSEQRDRDNDGVGDACDTCPSTPNGGKDGRPGQDGCTLGMEAEPNDDPAMAQAISMPPAGSLAAISGVVESPRGGLQAFDFYRIMVPAGTLLEVRAARSSPDSLLEPAVEVTGGSFTATRAADGLFAAERQIYASQAGVYSIRVSDRRGKDEPHGSPTYGYELSVRAIDFVPERVAPPITGRAVQLTPRGSLRIFTADLMRSERVRFQIDTGFDGIVDGIDPILVLEADGQLLDENDNFAPGIFGSRLLRELTGDGSMRIVLDYGRIAGDTSYEVALTIDYPAADRELEPNDLPSLASELVYCNGCQTSGFIDEPPAEDQPDVDWFVFQATAGQVVSFRTLVSPNSQVDPSIAIGELPAEGQEFAPIYANRDSSGISARADAIFHQAGTYLLRVSDQRNDARMGPPYHGGALYAYTVLVEVLQIPPAPQLLADGTYTGVINPGGKVDRYLATVAGPTTLTLTTARTGSPDLDPEIRVYAPGASALIASGTRDVTASLPAGGTYVIGVHNGNFGLGGPMFTYEISADFDP